MADNTVMVSLDNRLNPEYPLPFFCLDYFSFLYLFLCFENLEIFRVINCHFNPEVIPFVIHFYLVLIGFELYSVSLIPVS